MHVITIDYALDDKHITRCDEALFDGTNISRIENYIKIFYSPNQTQDKYAMQTSSAQMDMAIERA